MNELLKPRCFICQRGTSPAVLCEECTQNVRQRERREARSRRRRFYALYRRLRWVEGLLDDKEERGENDSRLKAERSALRWAIYELGKQYPEECDKAREDLQRDGR